MINLFFFIWAHLRNNTLACLWGMSSHVFSSKVCTGFSAHPLCWMIAKWLPLSGQKGYGLFALSGICWQIKSPWNGGTNFIEMYQSSKPSFWTLQQKIYQARFLEKILLLLHLSVWEEGRAPLNTLNERDFQEIQILKRPPFRST